MINENKQFRKSIRLTHYDYSQEGAYFITICTQERNKCFGTIENRTMYLNNIGLMVKKWWDKTALKYPCIKLGKYVIMPDHFHGIISIVGANPCVRPQTHPCVRPQTHPCVRPQTHPCVRPNSQSCYYAKNIIGSTIPGSTRGSTPTVIKLGDVIKWFKTMTTCEYIKHVRNNKWPSYYKRLWQRNYYDHIIRTEEDYLNISEYIISNPLFWDCSY